MLTRGEYQKNDKGGSEKPKRPSCQSIVIYVTIFVKINLSVINMTIKELNKIYYAADQAWCKLQTRLDSLVMDLANEKGATAVKPQMKELIEEITSPEMAELARRAGDQAILQLGQMIRTIRLRGERFKIDEWKSAALPKGLVKTEDLQRIVKRLTDAFQHLDNNAEALKKEVQEFCKKGRAEKTGTITSLKAQIEAARAVMESEGTKDILDQLQLIVDKINGIRFKARHSLNESAATIQKEEKALSRRNWCCWVTSLFKPSWKKVAGVAALAAWFYKG
jgi:hypothetical protein